MIAFLLKLNRFLRLLSPRERGGMALILLGMLITGIFEVAGVGSVVPFLALAGKPEIVQTNHWVKGVYDSLGFHRPEDFIIATGFAVIAFLFFSNLVKALVFMVTVRLTKQRMAAFTLRLFEHFLLQPYHFFLNKNSSDLYKNMTDDLPKTLDNILDPLLDTISKFVIVVGIAVLIMVTDFLMAVSVIAVLGLAYFVVFASTRRKLTRAGKESDQLASRRFRLVSESVGGIKEVKFTRQEAAYLSEYSKIATTEFLNDAKRDVLSAFPRYLLETVAFGGIIGIVLVYLASGKNLGDVLPLLGLYAFAGYRLMPYLQQIYYNVARIRFAAIRLDRALEAFASGESNPQPPEHDSVQAVELKREIRVSDLTYRYPKSDRAVLDRLTLSIASRSTVGIVGFSGAGKSTLVDLLLGLLDTPPNSVFIDDRAIGPETIVSWSSKVGYVPQTIYLSDTSIASNIAFGVPAESIDQARVENVARLANLDAFVRDQLPLGYETKTGERGVQLSGGQRQRIGIARALYRNPEVLILDEATSALDGVTETEIMDAIHNLGKSMTIIIVAHRLTTLKACDNIFVLDSGRVVDQGTYSALMETNAQFREMAGQGKKA